MRSPGVVPQPATINAAANIAAIAPLFIVAFLNIYSSPVFRVS
jgi:hypothetical protein